MGNKSLPFRGHQYNPVTGFIDHIENNGKTTSLFQVPKPQTKTEKEKGGERLLWF